MRGRGEREGRRQRGSEAARQRGQVFILHTGPYDYGSRTGERDGRRHRGQCRRPGIGAYDKGHWAQVGLGGGRGGGIHVHLWWCCALHEVHAPASSDRSRRISSKFRATVRPQQDRPPGGGGRRAHALIWDGHPFGMRWSAARFSDVDFGCPRMPFWNALRARRRQYQRFADAGTSLRRAKGKGHRECVVL